MCFGGKPKLKPPKMQSINQTQSTPIVDQTPKVQGGADVANANRNAKKTKDPNGALSLFQIQLMPGSTGGTDTPGATSGPMS